MKYASVEHALLIGISLCFLSQADNEALRPKSADDSFKQLLLTKEVGRTLFEKYRHALSNLKPTLNSSLEIGLECLVAFGALVKDPQKMMKYIDAAGKPHSGFYRGNLVWEGSYAECLSISDSKYCFSTIGIPNVTSITWGACFPKSCSTSDIGQLLKFYIFPKVDKVLKVALNYAGSQCPGKPSYTTGVKVTLVFCGLLLLVCLIGTVIDQILESSKERHHEMENHEMEIHEMEDGASTALSSTAGANWHAQDEEFPKECPSGPPNWQDDISLLPRRQHTDFLRRTYIGLLPTIELWRDFFLCFSLVRNTAKLFNTNVSPTAITCINGIRVISITWVILGHVFLLFISTPLAENRVGLLEDDQSFTAMPIINAFFSVDSFFFLSGLLVAYTCLRKIEKSSGVYKFNWLMFYVHRFWRLTPSFMFVIVFSIFLKRFLSNGPAWFTQFDDKLCREHWWTNLLYINNFYPKDMSDECIGWTWYLANDMQFFVITPPLLMIVYKFGFYGLLAPTALLQASTVTTAAVYGYYDLDPFILTKMVRLPTPELSKKVKEFERYVYIKPYCRIQPYLVGFILGYLLYRNYNRMRRPGWMVTLAGWALAVLLGMGLVYGPHWSTAAGAHECPLAARVVIGALGRLLWGLALAWVTYACHYHAGGLIQMFLSARFWIPLSRLTYSVYLVHVIVLNVMFIGPQGLIHYDLYTASYYFLAAVVLSYGAGFILAVTVEFPSGNLLDMAIKNLQKSRHNSVA